MADAPAPTWLDLYDWRQRVAALYRARDHAWLSGEDRETVWQRFRAEREALFARHPQSPLTPAQREAFTGLRYFPYDAQLCVPGVLRPEAPAEDAPASAAPASGTPLRRAGRVAFTLGATALELVVYWVDVYGGGLFLPFRDSTGATDSYGGGRYLIDTVKGSDFLPPRDADEHPAAATLGSAVGLVVLDFNYAYNPSCAYDSRWACPLAPRENWLTVPITAGEQRYA